MPCAGRNPFLTPAQGGSRTGSDRSHASAWKHIRMSTGKSLPAPSVLRYSLSARRKRFARREGAPVEAAVIEDVHDATEHQADAPAPDLALRAYKFALDPSQAQLADLARHAGAQRWSYNYALARKIAAHRSWRTAVDELVESGIPEAEARKQVKTPIPNAAATGSHWRAERGDLVDGIDGVCPWWREVSSYAISTGFRTADVSWKNFVDSRSGKRAGPLMGYPRFKAKGRSTDSFSLFHDAKKPTIRPDGYRRLLVPRIGSVRLHESNKRLARLIDCGHAVVKSVTISRSGTRWYASVLCELTPEAMRHREEVSRARQKVSKKRQAMRPNVGVEWGVRTLVMLSDETVFDNPRHGKHHSRALRKASQAVSRKPLTRGQPSSSNRGKAVKRLGAVHSRIAVARRGTLNQISTRITINYPAIAVRDLAVKQMTRSAKGTMDAPGREVKVKSTFNRAVLDTAPGELRRQFEYKASQYGTRFLVAARDLPSSQICSKCGWRDPSIPLAQMIFRCGNIACGAKLDREINAARNILHHALPVASDSGETKNACGEGVSPPGNRRLPSAKQEGQPRRRGGSSRGSDPPASLNS
jgi:putative transposase